MKKFILIALVLALAAPCASARDLSESAYSKKVNGKPSLNEVNQATSNSVFKEAETQFSSVAHEHTPVWMRAKEKDKVCNALTEITALAILKYNACIAADTRSNCNSFLAIAAGINRSIKKERCN